MQIPRIALLTWCTPESRYAGGAAVRRLLAGLPADRIRWCGFHAGASPAELPAYQAFAPRAVHWRLRGTWLEHAAVDVLQARQLAGAMQAWLEPFAPQVLWAFPEVWAVSVGAELQRRMRLPLHVTVHDAPESAARGGIPRCYLPAYRRRLRRLLRAATSADAVSEALLHHLREAGFLAAGADTLVLPPCVPHDAPQASADPAWPAGAPARRIGLCGSFRESPSQWAAFLRLLGALPFTFTLVSFTPPAELPPAPWPANVTLAPQPYAATEQDVIRALAATDACYLGLWTEPDRRLFGETSVSSKLTTYAAAARPIIVDATEQSVAWQLAARYQAGIRLGDRPVRESAEALHRLFSDAPAWRRLAEGARELCRAEFDLEANRQRLLALLERTATGSTANCGGSA